MKQQKPFRICGCQNPLHSHTVKWLPKLLITPDKYVKFYNCTKCNTTLIMHTVRKAA